MKPTNTTKLQDFINKTQKNHSRDIEQESKYHDIPTQLNSISWQLKRIADALEKLTRSE